MEDLTLESLTLGSGSPMPGTENKTTEHSTLFPKITGKLEDIIHNYRFRNGHFDTETQTFLPGPPEDPEIKFIGTVKLHGTHADLVFEGDGTFRLQSRNKLSIDIEHDNHGVAKGMLRLQKEICELKEKILERWKELNPGIKVMRDKPVVIAGEWIGPGVQKSVAIEKLEEKAFVIISLSVNDQWLPLPPFGDICNESTKIFNISRGGFYDATLNIDKPTECTEKMQALTNDVEKECPFAKSFGISGLGEGIVWKPVREDLRSDPRFWLKTKGPLHRQVERLPKDIKSAEDKEKARIFAEAAVGEMRLQQAWDYLGEMEIKKDKSATSKFCGWLSNDVEVEEKGEIEKLGVDRGLLKKAIQTVGRTWYFKKLEAL
jgi:hypothetical protein